ncbi:MAG: GNAT family N-acetyltransferase [Bacteroidota bacterium]|nr:GNAT family N-acetyltransferase [Bacteroidota bacterium]MDP3143930.1 GNAT family N-acetyltransferase [Bacteroidota bacterium]
MKINIQPTLENDKVILYPLLESDFEKLYEAAADPQIWEQHPNKNRWQRDVFKIFFEGAIQSKGAFKIIEKSSAKIIGSTRFYDYNEQTNSVLIGYTFFTKQSWGKGINHSVKKLILDYIFEFVQEVYFHIGADNIRSQIAISRLGATKITEQEVTYFGEQPKLNFVYRLAKNEWL